MSYVAIGTKIIQSKNINMGLLNLIKRISKGAYNDPTKALSGAEVDGNWQKINDLFPDATDADVGKTVILKSDKSGFEYAPLPTIPTVGNGVMSLKLNGVVLEDTFSANETSNKTIDLGYIGSGDTFPNGVVEVSVTRDLQASDKGKLLVVTTSDVVLTMPETAPFNELDKVMIQPNINTSVQPKHNSPIIKLLAINDQVAYSFPKVTFIYQDALGLMPINGVVNKVDGEYADEMIKYLYERDNVAPLNYLLDENGDPILDENGNPIINEN